MKLARLSIARRQSSSVKLSENEYSLVDPFGRKHDYLRFSLTERCNLRCRYCMPDNGVNLTPKQECLNLEETKRLMNIFVLKCGISKVRMTGGEPTLDPKLIPMLKHLGELRAKSSLETVAMTTNGMTLRNKSTIYKDLGKLNKQ